jgi:8-oxo-dGTP pyrophosphatase MutT (NUDIX family)
VTLHAAIADGVELPIRANGHDWIVSWHAPPDAPTGRCHGSAGICVTDSREIVLISSNGSDWDFPAGRPQGAETWEQTLRREVLEEACATVVDARLLGFSRGRCVSGPERGLVLVRSLWRAEVVLGPWEPEFETSHRCVVPTADLLSYLSPVFMPIYLRALNEGGLL